MLSWVNSNLLTEENLFTSEIDLYDDGSGIEINEHSLILIPEKFFRKVCRFHQRNCKIHTDSY